MSDVIKAAGGIVERWTSHGFEIAVIHRTRYGSEWCLPKGKLKNNESWEEAAVREVLEETGFECAINGFVGAISYLVKNTPKVVLFSKMIPQGEPTFKPSEEVDKLEWLTPADAICRLQHPEEIDLLRRVYGLYQSSRQSGLINRIKTAIHSTFHSRRKRRLKSSITVYRQELHRRSLSRNLSNEASLAINEAFNLLCLAEQAMNEGDIDKGWKCFLGAQRIEIYALEPRDELRVRALVLREEANKLRSWRKTAMEALLGTNVNPKDVKDTATIYEATLIRDEHYNNEAYKASLKRDYNLSLLAILALIIFSIFFMLDEGIIRFGSDADHTSWQMVASVAIFGLLGGVVSAIIKEMDVSKPSKIPEVVTAIRVTLLRIFVGAAFALVVYLFMKSQVIEVFSTEISGYIKGATPFTIYVISFVAGFTERVVLRAVSVVAGKEG